MMRIRILNTTALLLLMSYPCQAKGYQDCQNVGGAATSSAELNTIRDTSIVLFEHGHLRFHKEFEDGRGPSNHVMSITKSITSLLTGIAIGENLIGPLDEPFSTRFPSLAALPYGSVTAREILQQASCLESLLSPSAQAISPSTSEDIFALLSGVSNSCGQNKEFQYSNLMPNVLSQVIELATGQSMQAYARDKLFRPLGIEQWSWTADAMGHTSAEAGLMLTALDVAKIGQMLLQDGTWLQQEIVPRAFVDELRRSSETNAAYSLLFWVHPKTLLSPKSDVADVVEAQGWAGQTLVVDYDHQRVSVMLTRPEWAWDVYTKAPSAKSAEEGYEWVCKQLDCLFEDVIDTQWDNEADRLPLSPL